MKLFAKFFLSATFVISIALLISGYLLITISFDSAVGRETERALNQFQFDRFTVQSALLASGDSLETFSRLSSELSGQTAFFSEDKQLLYSALPSQADFYFLDAVTTDNHLVQFQNIGGQAYILVCGKLSQNDITLYFLVANDISSVITQREQMSQSFREIYFFTLLVSVAVVLILSSILVRPIKKMNIVASKMAQGHYSERLLSKNTSDEIGELSVSFNLMAEAIEEKIYELSENARQKEDFVANFAHELKTPLTSVIGYADMIYQKNLSPEQIKDSAYYILNEGLRLEALSIKLMDLIVLNRQNFILEEINSVEFFSDVDSSLKPMLTDKNVSLFLDIQSDCIKVEYDLFKTLIFNLIDNSVKAGCTKIEISGVPQENRYIISVIDNGRGIPSSELSKIT